MSDEHIEPGTTVVDVVGAVGFHEEDISPPTLMERVQTLADCPERYVVECHLDRMARNVPVYAP